MSSSASVERTADRLHSAAIHLLRRVRASDAETGLSPARLSALSVLVFGGPRTISELANAEQVRLPTMSALVRGLEDDGLVARRHDRSDRRAVVVRATARGARLLHQGRRRRVEGLAARLRGLDARELKTLGEAAQLIEQALGRDPAPRE